MLLMLGHPLHSTTMGHYDYWLGHQALPKLHA
jgi:hypothetical protein